MSADLLFHGFIVLIIGPREIKRGYTLLVASIWFMNESCMGSSLVQCQTTDIIFSSELSKTIDIASYLTNFVVSFVNLNLSSHLCLFIN